MIKLATGRFLRNATDPVLTCMPKVSDDRHHNFKLYATRPHLDLRLFKGGTTKKRFFRMQGFKVTAYRNGFGQ